MADRKKPEQKYSAKQLREIFKTGFEGESSFAIIEEGNPFLFQCYEKKYYAFLRNLCHGGGGYPDTTTRIEFPKKDEFNDVKDSDIPVLVMGYDEKQDVFVCWEPKKSKARLNEKGYVSFFARKPVQESVSDGVILASFLENKDAFIAVKRKNLPLFIKFLDFFPSGPVPFIWNPENIDDYEEESSEESFVPQSNYVDTNEQIIFYGVPGCGKSDRLLKKLAEKKIPQNRTQRVVFHPDYSISDFVGQILPTTKNKKVIYDFQPGPFSEILYEAYHNPTNSYALIIEEINRGNAAAIFGEIFQLLDRKIDDKKAEGVYGKGWSDYFVNNENLRKYLNLPPKEGVRLPPNLSIFATMNTSDQNVFLLDNAFQRRWNMELIKNTLKSSSAQYTIPIEGLDCTWGKFRDEINLLILQASAEAGLSSLEDKRLGAWFVQADKDGSISKKLFSNKVLKYLWDDAFKSDRQVLFENSIQKSFDDIVEDFERGKTIFKNSFIENITSKNP